MVSDAALGFVTGFMRSSYVEGLRFKQTARRKAQTEAIVSPYWFFIFSLFNHCHIQGCK